MIVVIDADYNETGKTGHVAGVLAKNITDEDIIGFVTSDIENIEEYESGSFYKRELQSVEAILGMINIKSIDMIVVDGYAAFDEDSGKNL